jgi:MOSC domain-containing protein YiiM
MNYLYQINVSKGGVPKLPIVEVEVNKLGIVGDKQKDLRYHGGPERAICLFDLKIIEALKLEGHPIFPGSTGENLTIVLSNYNSLTPGVQLAIGKEVVLEISSYTAPCKTIQKSFINHEFKRISQKLHPQQSRLYARVIKGGHLKKGDIIELIAN